MPDIVRLSSSLDTFPRLLLHHAQVRANQPAIREKDLGIWQSWTWSQVAEEVRALACGLAEMGFKRGDNLAIIGDNRPRLYWAMCAAQCLGGVPVPMYQDAVAAEMAFVLLDAEIRFAIVEDQEQVDKMLEIKAQCPQLQHILYDDPRGMRHYNQPFLHGLDEVQQMGRIHNRNHTDFLDAEIAKGKPDDVGIMLYTSGTTGKPKGVCLTHAAFIQAAQSGCAFDKLGPEDNILSYLPMAWVGDHLFSYAQAMYAGFTINCPESGDTVMTDLREIGPTYYFAPPRVFENLLTQVMIRMEDAGPLGRASFHYFMEVARRCGAEILDGKPVGRLDRMIYAVGRAAFHYFMEVARRCGAEILDGKPVGRLDRMIYAVGDLWTYGPLRNVLGMSRIRVAYTAGAAIGPDLFRFYRSIGINLKQLYGSTETCAAVCLQPDGQIKFDTVGPPAPGVEVKIADNGEVLVRGAMLLKEYYKRPGDT
ncbi:MAG: AMP-binding protein, partial [Rhodocyclales bacterium]|nr:AMP-binding protein [Rhodocyclales bacterium]